MAERPELDPHQWCRPVVHAAIDPSPLSCWLTLTQGVAPSQSVSLTGMNFGDLPPWSAIDVEAIAADLARFEQELARQAATTRPKRQTTAGPNPTGGTPPTPAGDLQDRCLAGDFNACLQLFESGGGSGGGGGGGVPEAPPEPEIDWEAAQREHEAWVAEMNRRLREAIAAQCPGGGSGMWYSDGSIYVTCY
jgi:hypothetical protein